MSTEPLIPGPLYGLRTWRVVAEDGAERLAAPHRGTPWPAGGEWLEAACDRHAAPAAGCDCGVHGWHPRRSSARDVLASRRELPGVVEADGATEVHADGFRAERGRPYALFVLPGRNGNQIARLAESYRAQMVEVGGPDELLAWCSERGLGMREPVVAGLLDSAAKPRRRRPELLRVAAALAIAAVLVVLGLQFIPEPPPDRTLYGRAGEIQKP